MSVTEVKQAIGRWTVKLREETPVTLLDKLTYFGHIALIPGEIDPAQYNDNLLNIARYVGVYRGRDAQNTFTLKGSGMVFWLGDEDDKGDVFESAVVLSGTSFANTIRALLPVGGAITEGTLHSVPGTYTGRHQWQTPREALAYVTDLYDAEFRINNNGTLDAGLIADLYVTTPKTLILPKGFGSDLVREAIPGDLSMGIDVEDVTTRVVLLAEGEGTNIATASANAPATPYKDIHGNPVKLTRLVSESGTEATNAAARAQLQLNRFLNARRSVDLSTDKYDVKGTFVVGDYIDVYDPVNGFYDANREIYWQGERINPMALRCVEMTWPIPPGWTVAFRDINGNWIDLSRYYVGETGETTIVVGDLARGLSSVGGEPVGVRPNLPDNESPGPDGTIPDAPVFTGFSSGVYESDHQTLSTIQITWDQPLNTDGSTIIDGSHYELRYRPNAIIGTRVPWDFLSGNYDLDFFDTFDVPVTGGFGANWSGSGADRKVVGGAAIFTHSTFNVIRHSNYSGLSCANMEVTASHLIDYNPAGATTVMGVNLRMTSSSNFYWATAEVNIDASVTARVVVYRSGVSQVLAERLIPGMIHTAGRQYWTRASIHGDVITLKVWQGELDDQPQEDIINVWDQSPVTGTGYSGFMDWIVPGATNPLGSETKHPYFQVRDLAPDDPGSAYSWDDLGTWDAITSPPITVSPQWSSVYIGWDQNIYTLVEMSPGVQYEFQIRAVDTASPPNAGPWSPSSFVNTTGDVVAPSTPAPPKTVAASLIGVQVEHWLGQASGGNFNLELDTAFIEVHASYTPTFVPSADTKIGDLIVSGAMIRNSIPAVGSFKVDQAGSVWLRVVAVDRSGNRSGPSEAIQSNVALIDDAHISNLSVSKLTAGTITAQSVLAAQMEVGAGGNIRVTDGSFDAYDAAGNKRIEVGQLDDGTFDLAAFDPNTGSKVNLAQLAFGLKADIAGGSVLIPGNNTGDYDYYPVSDGPRVTDVMIGDSKRAVVFYSASIIWGTTPDSGNGRVGKMSFRVIRQSTGEITYPAFDSNCILFDADNAYAFQGRFGSFSLVQTWAFPAANELYTFEGVYQVSSFYNENLFFSDRSILVMPY